jgi:hypothetical protein
MSKAGAQDQTHEVIVDEPIWNAAEVGHEVVVHEGPGLFGWAWMIDVQLS